MLPRNAKPNGCPRAPQYFLILATAFSPFDCITTLRMSGKVNGRGKVHDARKCIYLDRRTRCDLAKSFPERRVTLVGGRKETSCTITTLYRAATSLETEKGSAERVATKRKTNNDSTRKTNRVKARRERCIFIRRLLIRKSAFFLLVPRRVG